MAYDMRRIVRFYALFVILIPSLLVILAVPPLLFSFIPIVSCCLAKHSRDILKYHGQPKYFSRLQSRRKSLEKLSIEKLNERRWARPREPKLHKYDGGPRAHTTNVATHRIRD